MTPTSLITGLTAATLLLSTGYLLGISRGTSARDRLRQTVLQLEERVRAQSSRRNEDEGGLQSAIQHVLAPLVERELRSLDLAQFTSSSGQRRDLSPLLDKIAAVGGFTSVLLSNEEGLPLASSAAAVNLEAMAAKATRMIVIADQITGEQGPAALSVMVRDATDAVTLCRLFQVQGQRLSLTAVSADSRLNAVALDPALVKIETVLSLEAGNDGV